MILSDLQENNNSNEDESLREQTAYVAEENYVDVFWRRQRNTLITSYVNSIIIIINILIFVYSLWAGDQFYDRFALDSEMIVSGTGFHAIFTAMFMHASLDHLFSNMIVLFFIGANAEHDLGHLPYLFMYMTSGIAGNIISIMYDASVGDYSSSIGASGAVFGVIGAVMVIVFFGRKHLRAGSNLMFRVGLMAFFSVYSGFKDTAVNNAAHIGGLLGGIIITLLITLLLRKEYTMEEWL